MSNPYQTPPVVLEPKRNQKSLLRRIIGTVFILVSFPPILFGGFLVTILLLGASTNSPSLILILGGLILIFGLGVGAFGLGIWMQRRRLTAYGCVAVFVSVSAYFAVAMVLY